MPSPAGLTSGSITLRKYFLRRRWMASQLELARVAQLYAPQVGETRLAVSSPAMTSASEIGAELLSAVASPFPPPRFWSKDRPARGDAASAPPKDAQTARPFFVPAPSRHIAERHAQADRHLLDPDHRRGADRHRAGLRVRLFRHAGGQGAQGRGLSDRPGQLQSGDDPDRSRSSRRHLSRTD